MKALRVLAGFIFMLSFLTSIDALSGGKRTTTIDFEDTLIEGVNKQPLDSLSQISEDKNKNDVRLYRKRAGFRDLMTRTLEELRDLQ
jgi:hypothetical protein